MQVTISLVFLTTFLVVYVKGDKPLVNLPTLGKIEGHHRKTFFSGRYIYSFEGIPYAHPPIGEYRFREPEPIKPWKGVWQATTIYKCMQYYQYTPPGQDYVVGDENCLYLNVHTPNLKENANLDVIVYIHGGSFMFNYGGLYGPEYLLEKDVLLVTFNYRLGPLGFLSTENEMVPGNNGLKDQILALSFVKNQIQYFGGNPNSITILGTSAGGVSVNLHYLSPKSRNLFHRGFSQSGTALVPWALMENPLEKTKKLSSGLGCPTENNEEMMDCLKTRPARQIVASVKSFQPWLYLPFSPFGPVVDSWSSDPVLPKHPYRLISEGQAYDVPWMVSYTNSEGLYPAEEFYEEHLEDVDLYWNELIPLILDYNYTVNPKLSDDVSQKIREFYLGEKKLSKSSFRDFFPILSDRLFVVDIQKTARLQALATKSPVYVYRFGYRGQNSWFQFKSNGRDFGAAHADDMAYIFKMEAINTTTVERDRQVVKFLVDIVTSYAKFGYPRIPITWSPLSKSLDGTFEYLKVDSLQELSVTTGTVKTMQFWNSLPIEENEKLFSKNRDEL